MLLRLRMNTGYVMKEIQFDSGIFIESQRKSMILHFSTLPMIQKMKPSTSWGDVTYTRLFNPTYEACGG